MRTPNFFVNQPPKIFSARRVPPQFFIRPNSSYSLPVGGSLELTCAAVGHPVPKVKWNSDNEELNAILALNEESTGRKTIKLSNLTKSLRLTCFAESSLGRIQISTTVNVGGESLHSENFYHQFFLFF